MEPCSISQYLHSIYRWGATSTVLKQAPTGGPGYGDEVDANSLGGRCSGRVVKKVHIYHVFTKTVAKKGRSEALAGHMRLGGSRVWKTGIATIGMGLLMLAANWPQLAIGANAMKLAAPASGLSFVPGSDSMAACVSLPCAIILVVGSGNAQVSLSFEKESVEYPQPATYYTDLLRLTNPTGSAMAVTSLVITAVSQSRIGDIGAISVFYCSTQTDVPEGHCEGSYVASGPVGGSVFSGVDNLLPGATRYIELEGFAGPTARVGDVISFTIEVVGR